MTFTNLIFDNVLHTWCLQKGICGSIAAMFSATS